MGAKAKNTTLDSAATPCSTVMKVTVMQCPLVSRFINIAYFIDGIASTSQPESREPGIFGRCIHTAHSLLGSAFYLDLFVTPL